MSYFWNNYRLVLLPTDVGVNLKVEEKRITLKRQWHEKRDYFKESVTRNWQDSSVTWGPSEIWNKKYDSQQHNTSKIISKIRIPQRNKNQHRKYLRRCCVAQMGSMNKNFSIGGKSRDTLLLCAQLLSNMHSR